MLGSGDNRWCLRHLNDMKCMSEMSHLAEHRTRATIAFLRELNGSCYRFWLDVMSCDDVFNRVLKNTIGFSSARIPETWTS